MSLLLSFAPQPSPPVLKRPRGSPWPSSPLTSPPTCRLRPSPLPSIALTAAAAAAAVALLLSSPASAKTVLSSNTILRRYIATDADAILRYSLPLPSEHQSPDGTPPPIRRAQELLERLGVDVRARGAAGLIAGRRDLAKLKQLLSSERLDILLDVPAKKRTVAAQRLSELEGKVADIEIELGLPPANAVPGVFPKQLVAVTETIQDIVESRNALSRRTNYDAAYLDVVRREALDCIADIEQLAVADTGLPYRIPRRYNAFPRLVGRATVEMKLVKSGDNVFRDKNYAPLGKQVTVSATLDGYSAPLTSGNFIDLARRGYYNDTRVLEAQRGFYTQLGEREDDNIEGFKDPKSGLRRQIPMEILVDGDPAPTYGGTLDELGIGDLQPALPISAYGAMAMVHSVEDPNDASSQFYLFLLDPTSYQARSFGGSALTGTVSTFGYAGKGKEYLAQLEAGDKVASVKLVAGEENFREHGES